MKVYDKIEDHNSMIDFTDVHGSKNDLVHKIIVEDISSFSKSIRPIKCKNVIEGSNLFSNVYDLVLEIVTGIYPYGVLEMSKQQISDLGFRDIKTFEEEWLRKVFTQIAKDLKIDLDEVFAKMKGRISCT